MAIRTAENHYPICGKDVAEPDFKRFREWACSEARAEEYLKDVRAQKFRIVAPEPRRSDRPARRGAAHDTPRRSHGGAEREG